MIVISGITSGLGISLAKLLSSKGIPVRGFARNIQKAKEVLDHPLIELQKADLTDYDSLMSACEGATVIVHIAALSSPWGDYKDFYKTNVKGTKFLLHIAKKLKLKRFVHISTPSLYFEYQDKFNVSESDPLPISQVNAYAETKKMAEDFVDKAFSEGVPCITLRPRALFGPHDQTVFPRILKACEQKGIPCFTSISPIIDITYVDNVAYAIELAINAPTTCLGEKYNITNGEPRELWGILGCLLTKLSIPLQKRKIPLLLAYSAAMILGVVGKIRNKEPILTKYGIGLMTYSHTLSIHKAQTELNYHPLITIDEGINRYVSWIQTQKNL